MIARLLHLLDPHRRLRPLPPPDPRCKAYTFAEAVVLFRNHDTARRISAAHK